MTATVAGRIGYPGLLLSLLSPDVSLSYWDYQARIDGGSEKQRWSLFCYGAQDVLKGRDQSDEPLKTLARFEFHRIDLRYQHGDAAAREVYRLVFGYDDSALGSEDSDEVSGGDIGTGSWSVTPQLRLHRALLASLDLDLGLESNVRTVKNPPAIPDETPSSESMTLSMILNRDGIFTASGAFAQLVAKPTARLRLIPGVRGDVYHQRQSSRTVTKWNIDPRLLARYRLGDKALDLWVKGVIGRYHQPPRLFLPVPGLDSSSLELGLLASTQYSLGVEVKLGAAAELDLNVYYNAMDPVLFDLTINPDPGEVQQVQPAQPAWQPGPPSAGEDARAIDNLFKKRAGRSYGLELLLRKRDTERLFGWVSYTLSRSDRQQTKGWEPFDFDRLHMLNLVAGLRLPRNWEIGGRVLLQSGTPLTTIFGRNLNRSDGQFRFDIRLDKRAVWNRWLLDFYVDIINTTVAEESGGLVGGESFRYLVPTIGFGAIL
jgi:hypothetical protein